MIIGVGTCIVVGVLTGIVVRFLMPKFDEDANNVLTTMDNDKQPITLTTIKTDPSSFYINVLINGDAETGPCELQAGVTPPTAWQCPGGIRQLSYENEKYGTLFHSSAGPRYVEH